MTINGKNYFNQESLKEMKEALRAGEEFSIYIDCIGHTRAAYTEAAYMQELKKEFGDELIIEDKHGFNTYRLKGGNEVYDYSKLRGRIVEKYNTMGNYAVALGISRQALSNKMRNTALWRQDEIHRSMELLDIADPTPYFFEKKV